MKQNADGSAMEIPPATVPWLLGRGAAAAPAIGAPGQTALSFEALRGLVSRTHLALLGVGVARSDRVAIVLPNGPMMATAFLGVSCAATAAPLNPAYRSEELAFYLSDLNARALIVQRGQSDQAREVAISLGIPVIDAVPGEDAAGDFVLVPQSDAGRPPADRSFASADDVALVLHTSGTTARPKIVPLTHGNLAASADSIGRSLALTPADICLNIMPLFHIHGLIAAVLSSVAAGGSVVCCPGLNAFRFFKWFDEIRPTWFTAVPTMHQTILELAPRNQDVISRGRLRLIRSSSASLPGPVMTRLEETFGVPVIEAYGMTEASHQMTSNPLPPRPHYPGCVGIAAGPEVAIMDDQGNLLAANTPGEVVIRGDNVTHGYENNPEANAKSFVSGWFRTGDEGVIDADGYLRLTGRLKEIINRAGEKVSPLEVDQILMQHPAVLQVVTFAMPSRLFGEDVAAAVVLREGHSGDAEALRRFTAERLAAFKVPREILFVDDIPKGATGKLQRIGLAARLGLGDTEEPGQQRAAGLPNV